MEISNVVIIAGAGLVHAGMAPVLREIVDHTEMGVFNTWTAKGLFPWDHPAHFGTIGLQSNDIALAGLSAFDDVVLCGVSDDELERAHLSAADVRWRDVAPTDLEDETFPVRSAATAKPPLFDILATVCAPLYADETLPTNPARAAADLSAALPTAGVVCADACRSGFWIGRTFPTRHLGSVVLPTKPTAGFAATQAATAGRTGRFAVAVVDGIDAATQSVMSRANNLIIELWSQDCEVVPAAERLDRLFLAQQSGGVHVFELGVRFGDISFLIEAAGAPRWQP